MGSIKSIAGDCEKTHRWCLANLTDDDANDSKREKLTTLRIVKIGSSLIQAMSPGGDVYSIDPNRIQRVW